MVNKTKMIVEPGQQEIFIVREFDASRELVFTAFTDPKLYSQWLWSQKTKSWNQKMVEVTDLSTKMKKVANLHSMMSTVKFLDPSEL